jgi:hypothetical protein
VLSGDFRQNSLTGVENGRPEHFYHCTVSYVVAGETRQYELNSPSSQSRIDAEVWAARWSRGQRVAILYKNSDPSRVLLADNPAELTTLGVLKLALCLFIPGMLLLAASHSERSESE